MSDKLPSIYEKIMLARKEFHSASIVKTGYNKHSKYSYFELSDFLVPAMAIMGKQRLVTITSFTADTATMTVHDLDSDASFVITSPMSEATLPACQPVQSLGGVETYQRRYLWVALLEIIEHDVIEETAKVNPDQAPESDASDEQLALIEEYKEAGTIPEVTLKWIEKNSPLTEKQASSLLGKLKEAE